MIDREYNDDMRSTLIHDTAIQAHLQDVLNFFLQGITIDQIFLVNSGHINDTYRVHVTNHKSSNTYILQKINTYVFKAPEKLMENMIRVTSHIARKLEVRGCDPSRRVSSLKQGRDGNYCLYTESGEVWRLMGFIYDTHAYDEALSESHAYEAAKAFGMFQSMLIDLEEPELHMTIPDFHTTPVWFARLEQSIEENKAGTRDNCQAEINFALARKEITTVLADFTKAGLMRNRPTHNDTKINNVLLDKDTGEGICVIDLDTVMPGLPLYDFGDCVRSTARTGAEDEKDLNIIRMDCGMFEAITRGYLEAAGSGLTELEKKHLAFSAKLITFEIGIRFLADYLNGDVYFKTSRPGQNLDRARVHFTLIQSMEQQESRMKEIVDRYCSA